MPEHFECSRIRNFNIFIKYQKYVTKNFLYEVFLKYQKLGNVLIHDFDDNISIFDEEILKRVSIVSKPINSNLHCGTVSPHNFDINKQHSFESLKFNSCLNKKVSIDVNGGIKNCPSIQNVYGNIYKDDLF